LPFRQGISTKKKRGTSEYKSFSITKEFIPTLFDAMIIYSRTSILEVLNRVYSQIEKNEKKSHRKKKLTVLILKVSYERTIGKSTKGTAA
jgi:hypothetical protein